MENDKMENGSDFEKLEYEKEGLRASSAAASLAMISYAATRGLLSKRDRGFLKAVCALVEDIKSERIVWIVNSLKKVGA